MNDNKQNQITEEMLSMLLDKKDFAALADELCIISEDDIGKVELWKYRKYYRSLPISELKKSPILCTSLAMLALLSADIEKSELYVTILEQMAEIADKNSVRYRDIKNQLYYLNVAIPHRSKKNPVLALRTVERAMKQGEKIPRLSITSNRPSIINGGRDFTSYGKHFKLALKPLRIMANVLYGSEGVGMPDIAYTEVLYQMDETFEALVLVVANIAMIEKGGDVNTLFVAMYLQMRIMMVTSQIKSAAPMIEKIRSKIIAADAAYLLPNLNAISALIALYDGNYEHVKQWMNEEAPDEYGEFCTHDRFRYFIKLRIYYVQGNHTAMLGLADKLRPVLVLFDRRMERCELDALLALTYYAQGDKQTAFGLIENALVLAQKYRYDRLLGDEGKKMNILLRDYVKEKGESPFVKRIIKMTHNLAMIYPDYLKQRRDEIPKLTQTELEILRLVCDEKSNAEIAKQLKITIRTVKFHNSNILSKLSAKNRHDAVKAAKQVGIL